MSIKLKIAPNCRYYGKTKDITNILFIKNNDTKYTHSWYKLWSVGNIGVLTYHIILFNCLCLFIE